MRQQGHKTGIAAEAALHTHTSWRPACQRRLVAEDKEPQKHTAMLVLVSKLVHESAANTRAQQCTRVCSNYISGHARDNRQSLSTQGGYKKRHKETHHLPGGWLNGGQQS